MLTIKISDSTHREKDDNGFLIVRNNPIAKAGVFDYLLCEIMPDCKESERNKIVKVYRDWNMLKSVKDSFANKPIKDEHFWVGEDTNTADGAIGSEVSVDNDNLYLVADLFIYNPLLIEKIEKGEAVELSPAYTSEIVAENGSFNGVEYAYKQNIKCFNHLAVVENGRSGKDLKIQDKGVRKMSFKDKIVSAISKVFDELPETETQDNEAEVQDNKEAIIREIIALATKPESEFEGGEAAKIEAIASLVEKISTSEDSEAETQDEAETTDNEAETQDEAETPNVAETTSETTSMNVSELKQEILNEVAEAVQEAVVKAQDAMFNIQKEKEVAYRKVQDSVKAPFDYSKMSVSNIYKVGYEALTGNKMNPKLDAQTAFILASQATASVKTQDSSAKSLNLSKFK